MNDMTSMTEASGQASGATPMMAQYLEIRAANPGCLLFYRMGDFYELFFDDAETASRALGIALTKRGRHQGADIPMCGVPVAAADDYLQKLIRLGHRVAVCEQLEDPAEAKKRGSKSVVRRDVVRLVTPGTLTEDSLLEPRLSNYLAALARVKGDDAMALAWADISSGELAVAETSPDRLAADLARLQPSELILSDQVLADEAVAAAVRGLALAVTPLPASRFDSQASERRLKEHYGVSALDAFGRFSRAELAGLGGLLDYVLLTQKGRVPRLSAPRRENAGDIMLIDPATRANLELVRTVSGDRQGSLLAAIDMTATAGGARLLASRLATPLTEVAAIAARLDDVEFFFGAADRRDALRERLRQMPDLERALGRLSLGRGGPRDLQAVAVALAAAETIAANLAEGDGLAGKPANIAAAIRVLQEAPHALAAELGRALADELPHQARDGGFVRKGYSADLDELRVLRDETRQVIAGLQARYARETGIRSLKVKHNNVLGYFIEVPAQQAAGLGSEAHGGTFIHRQTMAGAMRFATVELAGLEEKIASAAGRALAIEQEIFGRLAAMCLAGSERLAAAARACATLDVAAGLAELARMRRYVRPEVDLSCAFEVKGGRHPVVELSLAARGEPAFIPNDCALTANGRRIWLLTGPNMAGKSTFLRQNALIAVLAQMGSFVPAAAARIGIIDRLFSRVGAADDLARGRSTFMVEMVETAAILNQGSERSFVILDEIGRGTATFDGLSIAWAAIEHLHETNRCRALFATHYHELTALAARLPALANATVKVREWNGEVVFLHEVAEGAADRSYGIQVARLAGLPRKVTDRAAEVLRLLEEGERARGAAALIDDLPLFRAASVEKPLRHPSDELVQRLDGVAADELSPRDALALVYELKALAGKSP